MDITCIMRLKDTVLTLKFCSRSVLFQHSHTFSENQNEYDAQKGQKR